MLEKDSQIEEHRHKIHEQEKQFKDFFERFQTLNAEKDYQIDQ